MKIKLKKDKHSMEVCRLSWEIWVVCSKTLRQRSWLRDHVVNKPFSITMNSVVNTVLLKLSYKPNNKLTLLSRNNTSKYYPNKITANWIICLNLPWRVLPRDNSNKWCSSHSKNCHLSNNYPQDWHHISNSSTQKVTLLLI